MKKILLSGAMLGLAMLPAKAGTFTADSFTQLAGAVSVTINSPATPANPISVGEIDLHQNSPSADLLVWCLDLQNLLFIPYTFQVTTYTPGLNLPGLPAGGLDASQLRQIASLMNGGLSIGGLGAADDDAATQLAIWRVEYGPSFSTNASGTLLDRMNLELADSVAGGILDCPTCTLTVLSDAVSAPNQAVGFVSNTPIPAAAWLFGTAMVGLVSIARRRRDRAVA